MMQGLLKEIDGIQRKQYFCIVMINYWNLKEIFFDNSFFTNARLLS